MLFFIPASIYIFIVNLVILLICFFFLIYNINIFIVKLVVILTYKSFIIYHINLLNFIVNFLVKDHNLYLC